MAKTKAVFFDWLNTIAHPQPDRHEIYSQVLPEFGIQPSQHKLLKAIYSAETQEPSGPPYRWDESRKNEACIRYQEIVLEMVDARLPRESLLQVLNKVSAIARKVTYAIYDDVLPTLKTLRERGLVLGLITTMGSDMNPILSKLDLQHYLQFTVSSKEVGVDKPHPPIFLAALERAGVDASAAIYVGDQYETDVIGARGVGIKPILIDRYDLLPEVRDCPRIHTVAEVTNHI